MQISLWADFISSLDNNSSQKKSVLLSFLKQLKPVDQVDGEITLGCTNTGLRIYLEKRVPEIEKIVTAFAKKNIKVKLTTLAPKLKKPAASPLLNYEPTTDDLAVRAGLSRRYRFDNFAVSTTNQVAYAAAQAIVDNLGSAYNPLFLYGGVGVGKTHLAQAVGHKIIENNGEKRVLFSPGDLFTNELIESIRERTTAGFRKKYRKLNLLIIDDVQFIAGKQAVQEEFFHTFNSIVSAGGQVIMTSDKPPQEIKNLEDRLRSRFSGGLIIDIQAPDFELRTAILLIKAKEKNIEIDIEAAKLIAEQVEDGRALEGTLLSIYAKILGKQEKILSETVLNYFAERTKNEIKKVSPADVIRAVCSYYNVKQSRVKSETRESGVVLPRQLIMYVLRHRLGMKLEEVARTLNRKDHTTVIHGTEKISRLISQNPAFKQEVDRIVSPLGLST